jgi:hypothetical protein
MISSLWWRWISVGMRVGALWLTLLGLPGPLPDSVARADQWIALFHHIHTNYSHDNCGAEPIKLGVQQVLARADRCARGMGVPGAVAITDHNNQDATADPAFHPVGAVQPVPGQEWSTGLGHANVIGALDKKLLEGLSVGADRETFCKTVDLIHRQGGIVIANHPRGRFPWRADQRLGVDAVEVWTGLMWKTWDEAAVAWWNRLLTNGERVTAIGGSDAHFILAPIECPMNLVFAKSNAPADMLAGIRAGRVMVLGGPAAPRILLGADAHGDGRYDGAMSGDVLPAGHDGPVRFQVAVEKAGSGRKLVLSDRSGTFFTGQIGVGPGWSGHVYRFERTFPSGQRDFVRAEVRRQEDHSVESLCNPIYVNLTPEQLRGSQPP